MSKVLVDRELLLFLNGEAELEGLAFGEHQSGKPFWWRKHLREAIARPAEAEGAKDYLTEFAEGEVEAKTAITELQDALSAVTAERDDLRLQVEAARSVCTESQGAILGLIAERDQLRAEAEGLQRDASRLDRLDIECEAYGCEGVHEGNRWMIDGPFRTVRDAIDAMAAKEA